MRSISVHSVGTVTLQMVAASPRRGNADPALFLSYEGERSGKAENQFLRLFGGIAPRQPIEQRAIEHPLPISPVQTEDSGCATRPPTQVAGFEYQFRPFRYSITFKNVSLHPDQYTSVRIIE